MNFLKKFNLNWKKIFKIVGIVLGCIILLSFALRFLKLPTNFGSVSQKGGGMPGLSPSMTSYDMDGSEEAVRDIMPTAMSTPKIATGGTSAEIMPPPKDNGATVGDDAEDFEVTEYNGNIETRHLDNVCKEVSALKVFDYVIFENAIEYDHGCDYTFKVDYSHVDEILSAIEKLDPKELSKHIYTIKRQIENVTSETEILEKKKASIDETLEEALSAYENITALATRTQNVESLAKIIDSKINIIERLTTERININEQLERMERAKAEQLDKLKYTYFYINVYENKFFDFQDFKDSWKSAVQSFLSNINTVIQDITINLLTFLFSVLQYVIYAFILLIIAKYGWRAVKYVWKK